MRQYIAILKSKYASNNEASSSSQGQNLESSNPVIQLGIAPTVPNVVATTGKLPLQLLGQVQVQLSSVKKGCRRCSNVK